MADPMMPKPITPTVEVELGLLFELFVRGGADIELACLVLMEVLMVKNFGLVLRQFVDQIINK